MKLAPQLMETAKLDARPRALTANNSLTRNQGMEPGPVANMTTNKKTAATPTNLRKSICLRKGRRSKKKHESGKLKDKCESMNLLKVKTDDEDDSC